MKLTTENATYKLMNEILNALNNKLIVGSFFCDLEKAFNCVNHDIFLSKLEMYGITGTDKELYHSYLKGRYQRVVTYNKTHHGAFSNWALIQHEIPQRPILGPLLFLLYMNDLPQFINNKSTPILFADDTSILFTHLNPSEFNSNTHTVLETTSAWFKNNYPSLNFEKLVIFNFRLRIDHLLIWRLSLLIS